MCIFIYVAGHPPSKCNLLRIDAMTETLFFSFSSRQNFVRLCFLGTARVFVATFCDGHPALLLLAPRRQLLPPIDFEVAPTTTPIDPPPLTGAAAAASRSVISYCVILLFYSNFPPRSNRQSVGAGADGATMSIVHHSKTSSALKSVKINFLSVRPYLPSRSRPVTVPAGGKCLNICAIPPIVLI